MTDKYPVPPPNETWEILEKNKSYDDINNCDKYSVLVNSINKRTGEKITKRVSRYYSFVVPFGLKCFVSNLPNHEKFDLTTLYHQNKYHELYNDICSTNDDKELQQNLRTFSRQMRTMVNDYMKSLESQRQQMIESRKNVKKFGKSSTDMNTTTSVSKDDVYLTLTHPELIKKYPNYHNLYANANDKDDVVADIMKAVNTGLCRVCKGAHFTHNCPKRSTESPQEKTEEKEKEKEKPAEPVDLSQAQTPLRRSQTRAKYVPPHMRNRKNNEPPRKYDNNDKPKVKTIRITNVAPYTEESYAKQECLKYGNIYNFKYFKNERYDRDTKEKYIDSITLYVTYTKQEVADMALPYLGQTHCDSSVWSADWAREKKRN